MSNRARSPLALALFVAPLLMAGCAAPAETTPSNDEPIASTEAALTGDQAVSRAEEWVAVKLQYCQSPNGARDYDSACSTYCSRYSNSQWDPYRSDCSGLVSWAWALPAPGRVTGEFAPFQTDITHAIDASQLRAGDAVNNSEHIMLFKAWTIPGKQATFIEEPGCSSSTPYAHEFTSNVTLSGQKITVAWNSMTFTAIRLNSIQASASYAAKYVSQSWPLASTALKMTAGQTVKASITLQNVGAKAWDSNTKLATTNPRDRKSAFVASDWLSPSRLDAVSGTVAPGADYKFTFSLHAPSTPGSYHEYLNLVEENVAWFSDPGQGGPADDVIEAWIEVAAAPPSTADAGGGADAASDASANDDAGPTDDAGFEADGGKTVPLLASTDAGGGCSTGAGPEGGAFGGLVIAGLAMIAMRARGGRR